MLPEEVNSVRSNCYETLEGTQDLQVNILKLSEWIFDIFYRSKDMEDFHHLQGKLELKTLNIFGSIHFGPRYFK